MTWTITINRRPPSFRRGTHEVVNRSYVGTAVRAGPLMRMRGGTEDRVVGKQMCNLNYSYARLTDCHVSASSSHHICMGWSAQAGFRSLLLSVRHWARFSRAACWICFFHFSITIGLPAVYRGVQDYPLPAAAPRQAIFGLFLCSRCCLFACFCCCL